MPGIGYITRVISGVRFDKMNKTLEVVKEKSGQSKARTFFDMLWCAARYGAGYYDYTMFGFYDMNGKQRDTYLTRIRNKKVCDLMNEEGYGDLFDDKLQFNPLFEKFLHRKVLDAGSATAKDMEEFMKDQEFFFAKPSRGTCGDGIEKCRVADFADAAEALHYVRSKGLMVLEHALPQHPDMARLHPESVNTMRIVTDRIGDEVYIAYIVVKIGRGDGFCDNSGQGGVICRVDPETGKINSVATDDYFNVFEKHPDTGITFMGYQLPMVKEAIEFAKEAAMVVPQIRHVGWDIAITPDGPALIEGNDYPGTDLCQLAPHFPEKQGLWPFYKEILDLK
ncbi:MAG: hypothetical protein IJ227_05165 [Mogibacterium sp.]|nr:hypothetical protein [Mogibacterium sp.]